MDKADIDNLVMEMAMEAVEEHDLEFDQSVIIQDDETVDAVFAAAMDFLEAEIVAAHEGEQLPFPLQLFGNIYDLQTVKPKPEYVAAVQRSIDALRECGVPVSEELSLD